MKKELKIIFITILFICISISCSKNDSPAKDYTTSIKGKTWWGTLTYTGETVQYYCVYFKPDNSLLWSQLSGDYQGNWTINGSQLILKFSGSNAEIKATISDDNKLKSIIDNTGSYNINGGQLITNTTTPLENTVWSGYRNYGIKPSTLQFNFISNSKVEIKVDGNLYGSKAYWNFIRSEDGDFIRVIGLTHFGVFTSENEMKGSELNSEHPWQVTKQ